MTFTYVHMGCQKCLNLTFISSQFSMLKIIPIFLILFSLKNISLEEGLLSLSFFENFYFWTTLFSKMVSNFWQSLWTSVKVKSKNIFFSDFFAKIYTLLTHVRKTPPLRSHYCFLGQIKLRDFSNLFGLARSAYIFPLDPFQKTRHGRMWFCLGLRSYWMVVQWWISAKQRVAWF